MCVLMMCYQVVLSGVFRLWRGLLEVSGSSGVECFQISRGFSQPPVTSCTGEHYIGSLDIDIIVCAVGLGDPAYFYIWCVFGLNGVLAGLMFTLGYVIR